MADKLIRIHTNLCEQMCVRVYMSNIVDERSNVRRPPVGLQRERTVQRAACGRAVQRGRTRTNALQRGCTGVACSRDRVSSWRSARAACRHGAALAQRALIRMHTNAAWRSVSSWRSVVLAQRVVMAQRSRDAMARRRGAAANVCRDRVSSWRSADERSNVRRPAVQRERTVQRNGARPACRHGAACRCGAACRHGAAHRCGAAACRSGAACRRGAAIARRRGATPWRTRSERVSRPCVGMAAQRANTTCC